MKQSLQELMDEYKSVLAKVEQNTGAVDEGLADAYFKLTGTVFPSEYMGMPVRKFNGTSFDLFNLTINESQDNQ